MPLLTDDALNKSIKSGERYPFYFLYGEETQLLQNTLALLLKKTVTPGFESFNLQRFDGERVTLNDVQTAYEALPMMAECKCVTVNDWNLDKLNKGDFDAFMNLLTNENPSTVLVLFYTNAAIDVAKSAKFKKICAIIEKKGVVCAFGLKDKATLRKALTSRCKKAGLVLPPAVCDAIIDRCGTSYGVLLNEMDKLISYAQDGEITMQAVELLCTESVQNTAFDLSNAVLQNNYARAFAILDRLFYLRMDPILMMGALNMSFIDLYRVKTAQTIGLSSDHVIADFHYRAKFRVTKLYKDVTRFSMEQIRHCICCLEKADRLLKSSKLDSRIILEQMLGEMSANRGAR